MCASHVPGGVSRLDRACSRWPLFGLPFLPNLDNFIAMQVSIVSFANSVTHNVCLKQIRQAMGRTKAVRGDVEFAGTAGALCSQSEELKDIDISRLTKLATLWSGYGTIYSVSGTTGEAQRQLIIKCVTPPHNDTGISHERKLHSYQVEASFYSGIAGRLIERGVPLAKPYVVTSNMAGDEYQMSLVLEDLRPLFPNSCRPLDLVHAKAALLWLAQFHSCFWGCPPKEKVWTEGTYWHLATRPDELESMGGEYAALKRAAKQIDEALKSEPQFQTLVHGDFKAANLLFSSGDTVACAAYDFQYVGGGSGMKDVAYVFTSSLAPGIAEEHVDELLEYYHTELTNRLPPQAAEEYTQDVMRRHFDLAVADFVRFMAGWGAWGNTRWAEKITRNVVSNVSLKRT